MIFTSFDFLWSPTLPWIYVGAVEPQRADRLASHWYTREGLDVCVRVFRSWKMQTTSEFMDEFFAVLQIEEGTGKNYSVVDDILCWFDDWIIADAYVFVFEQAEKLLQNQPEDIDIVLKRFDTTGDFWTKPTEYPEEVKRCPKPFHFILNIEEEHSTGRDRFLRIAAELGIPIRTSV